MLLSACPSLSPEPTLSLSSLEHSLKDYVASDAVEPFDISKAPVEVAAPAAATEEDDELAELARAFGIMRFSE